MSEAKPETSVNGQEDEKVSVTPEAQSAHSSELDLLNYHEHNAGRLVVTPEYVTKFDISSIDFTIKQPT